MKAIKVLLVAAVVILSFQSCTKEEDPPPEVEKNAEELLTAHPWKIQELRYVYKNVMNHFQRGIPGSVDYYANEWLHFKSDHTGVTNDNIPFTWQFLDAEQTKLRLVVAYTNEPTLTVNWEQVVVKESTMTYSEYWTRPDGPSVSIATRIPR